MTTTTKFGRNYNLTIWPKVKYLDGTVGQVAASLPPLFTIPYPFTIEFDITRKTLASCNVAQLRIYNLSLEHRNLIRFNASDFGYIQQIQFNAGYKNYPPIVFNGNISQAWSAREGQNMVTQIECFDGGFASVNGIVTNAFFPAGTLLSQVLKSIAGSLPNVSLGSVGSYVQKLPRDTTFNGNAMDILNQLTGGGFFIDNGKANCLGSNECIATASPTQINIQTGLLNTPMLENNIARFDMIFEPTLHAGESVVVTSQTEYNFNGTYKITGVKHKGIISGALCGSAITTGEFINYNVITPVAQL